MLEGVERSLLRNLTDHLGNNLGNYITQSQPTYDNIAIRLNFFLLGTRDLKSLQFSDEEGEGEYLINFLKKTHFYYIPTDVPVNCISYLYRLYLLCIPKKGFYLIFFLDFFRSKLSELSVSLFLIHPWMLYPQYNRI